MTPFWRRGRRRLERELREARVPLPRARVDELVARIGAPAPPPARRHARVRLAAAAALTLALLAVAGALGGIGYAASAVAQVADTVVAATAGPAPPPTVQDTGATVDTASSSRDSGGETTLCHPTGSTSDPYAEITVPNSDLGAYSSNPFDIIPAPTGGCPGPGGDDGPGFHQYGGQIPVCHRTGGTPPYVLIFVPNNPIVLLLLWLHGDIIPAPPGGCPTHLVPDTTPPTTPFDLDAHAAANPARVELSWHASMDNVGVVGYEISRNGTVVGNSTTTAFTDTTVASRTRYTYSVVALDAAGNRSPAATVTLTTPDLLPPSAVPGLTGTGSDRPPRAALSWGAATDDVGVAAYDVYRGSTLIATTTSRSASDTAVSAGHSYTYSVRARDAAGNTGPAATVTVAVPDQTPPSTPTSLKASTLSKPVRVSLTWHASTDNVGVTAYRVFRDGALVATVTTTSFTDASVAAKKTYKYAVAALDAAGNASPTSGTVSVTTPKS